MNNALLTITIGTHFFKINRISHEMRLIIVEFARRYIKYGLVKNTRGGGFSKEPQAVFGAATKDREEYRFHINQYDEFRDLLRMRNYPDSLVEVIYKPLISGLDANFKLKPTWVLRDYQVPVVDYLLNGEHSNSKIVEMQTGKGKGLVTLKALAEIGKKFAVLLRSMYVEKWVEEIQQKLDIQAHEIMVIQGGKNLQALINLAITDQLSDIKCFIISNTTYRNWLSMYEKYGDEMVELGYPIQPEDFFETIGCGVRVIDEIHLDLHLQFKTDLYTNVEKSIALSATFLSRDKFIEHVQEVMYPKKYRYQGGPLDKYISSTAVFYSIRDMSHIRTTERGSNTYSQTAFEKSIRRNPEQSANYNRLIKHLVDEFFMKDYKSGQRCAVYAGSIDTSTILTNHLKRAYPHLDVRRYVEDDPYENLIESDIRVTTVLSGGTAHDIDKLKTVILTNSLDSLQSNIQVMGRLRNLPDMPLRFVYLACTDIEKQMNYHRTKKELMLERAKVYQEYNAPISV